MERTLLQYDEYYNVLEKAWETSSTPAVSPEDIEKQMRVLFTLKHFGSKLKTLYECQQNATKSEAINEEYVHNRELQIRKDSIIVKPRDPIPPPIQQDGINQVDCTIL